MTTATMSGLLEEEEVADHGKRPLLEGTRIGRFVVLRDLEGRSLAVAAGSVTAVSETDDGALLMLSGGRMVQVPQAMETVLAWLDGRG